MTFYRKNNYILTTFLFTISPFFQLTSSLPGHNQQTCELLQGKEGTLVKFCKNLCTKKLSMSNFASNTTKSFNMLKVHHLPQLQIQKNNYFIKGHLKYKTSSQFFVSIRDLQVNRRDLPWGTESLQMTGTRESI